MAQMRVEFEGAVFVVTSSEADATTTAGPRPPKVERAIPATPVTAVAPKVPTAEVAKTVGPPKVAAGDGKTVQAQIRGLVAEGKFGEAALVADARGWRDQANTLRAKCDAAPLPKEAVARIKAAGPKSPATPVRPKAKSVKPAAPKVPGPIQAKLDIAEDDARPEGAITKPTKPKAGKAATKRDPNASESAKRLADDARLAANQQRLGSKIHAAIESGPIACDQLMCDMRDSAKALDKVVRDCVSSGDGGAAKSAAALRNQYVAAVVLLTERAKAAKVGV